MCSTFQLIPWEMVDENLGYWSLLLAITLHLWCCWPWYYNAGCGHNIFCMGMEGIDCMVFPWIHNIRRTNLVNLMWMSHGQNPYKNLQMPPASRPAATLHASVPRDSCPSGRQAGYGLQGNLACMISWSWFFFWIGKHKKKKQLVIRAIHDHNLTFHQSRIV